MEIANPIYDTIFKYLLEDNKIAKLLISKITGYKIESLNFTAQESTSELENRSLTVYRLDFAAQIRTKNNKIKK